jgi:hypothetical protein
MEKSNEAGFRLKEQIHGVDKQILTQDKQLEYAPPKKLEYFDPLQADSAEQKNNFAANNKPRKMSASGISGGNLFNF